MATSTRKPTKKPVTRKAPVKATQTDIVELVAPALRPLLSPHVAASIRAYSDKHGASPTSVVNIALSQWLDLQDGGVS